VTVAVAPRPVTEIAPTIAPSYTPAPSYAPTPAPSYAPAPVTAPSAPAAAPAPAAYIPPASNSPQLPSDPRDFVQTEGKTVIDKILIVDAVDILGGRLGGHGVIKAGTVTIGPGGILGPGNSPGILTIDGNLVITGDVYDKDPVKILGGVLEIEINGKDNSVPGAPQYDVLHVTGTATFEEGSSILFVFYSTFTPTSGDTWEFLTASAIDGLKYLTFSTSGLSNSFGYQVYQVKETENGVDEYDLYLRIYSKANGPALPGAGEEILYSGQVPAPSTVALSVLALAMVGWRMRRRVAKARVC
jgi:hypothetical protein